LTQIVLSAFVLCFCIYRIKGVSSLSMSNQKYF